MSPKTLRRTCLAITITVAAVVSSPAYAGEDWGSENRGGATEISKQSSVQQQQIPSEESHSSPDTQVNYSDPKTPRVVAVCQFNEDNKGEVRAYCDYGQTDQPAVSTEPITLTTRQAATLIAQGSGITRQPPGPKVIISMAFIVYTNPTPRYQTATILGSPIEVEFTPASYTWGWGDGTTTTTTDPGAPYPNQTVTHHYQHTATGVTTTLTTTWTTRYRPAGENQWRPIEGTITTTETSTPYDLVRVVTYLTDDAEEAQGH